VAWYAVASSSLSDTGFWLPLLSLPWVAKKSLRSHKDKPNQETAVRSGETQVSSSPSAARLDRPVEMGVSRRRPGRFAAGNVMAKW
jgi:hypothetical protein